MTSTITPAPTFPPACAPACPTDAAAPSATPSAIAAVGDRSASRASGRRRFWRTAIARFWGAGSLTPTGQALDAVDVPSFHR